MQEKTLGEIRRSIGRNLGIVVIGAATSTVDKTSLLDTVNLRGGDDDHNDKQVRIFDPAGDIVAGETQLVSDYDGDTHDATTGAFTESITIGDEYEMWETPWFINDINDAINQAIMEVSDRCLKVKEIHTPFTESGKYLYNCLSGFTHLKTVEYVYSIGTEKIIHNCNVAWDETNDDEATASADTDFYKEGGASLKLVISADAEAEDLMATDSIDELDLSGCTEVQIWIYSTTALDAGDVQLLLDDTASCVSVVESLDIPATPANTWKRHIISLANPQSDSAIISVGLKLVTDKGAFNLWADDIKAIDAYSNEYRALPMNDWNIARASTPLLMITSSGLNLIGENKQLRLTGWQLPSLLSADSDVAEIDPGYLILKTSGELAMNHAKSASIDMDNRQNFGITKLGQAQKMLPAITTSIGAARKVS